MPTCGKACITVSNRALIPLAIFNSFKTERGNGEGKKTGAFLFACVCLSSSPLAIRNTLMTRIMVGLIGIISDLSSSRTMPTTERMTMATSSWFHLQKRALFCHNGFLLTSKYVHLVNYFLQHIQCVNDVISRMLEKHIIFLGPGCFAIRRVGRIGYSEIPDFQFAFFARPGFLVKSGLKQFVLRYFT